MYIIIFNFQLINEESMLDSSFVSINSIFAGFLFTSLGIIVGILDKDIIKFLDRNGYLDSYINGIVIGLTTHLLSAILELSIHNLNLNISFKIEVYIKKVIFLLLFTGIVFFVKSMFNILKLIKIIRQQNN